MAFLQQKSVRETVRSGINNLADLQGALLTAIQIEFSTIPPYLCAQWSINGSNDPSDVTDMIENIVVQEMLHFGLACNMFNATGGSLKGLIATPSFVPTYPTNGLPGGVHPGLVVSLVPLASQTLQTFMAIEYPDGTPIVTQPATPPPPAPPAPPTIADFYQTIAAGFQAVFPSGTLPASSQVVTSAGGDSLFAIKTVTDALNAIEEITQQGEGTTTSPDEGTFDPSELAHYYTFAQIYYGFTVAPVGTGFQYTGKPITMPAVFPFAPQAPNAQQQAFIATFTTLMTQLESCWTANFSIDTAVGTMFSLQTTGAALIQAGITPQFTLQAS
jgi:hypothetical protein